MPRPEERLEIWRKTRTATYNDDKNFKLDENELNAAAGEKDRIRMEVRNLYTRILEWNT